MSGCARRVWRVSKRCARIGVVSLLPFVGACTSEAPDAAFAPVLSVGEPTRMLGVMEAPGLVLGVIADVEILDDGTILVADRSASAIHHLSPEGDLLATFGGPGEGPGEFQSPIDITLLANDEYGVLDADRFRVTRVQIEETSHRFVGEIPIAAQASRLCSWDRRLLLNAVQGDYALVRIDLSGAVVGRHYDLTDAADADLPVQLQDDLRDRARQGVLACSESGEVVFASEWMPDVMVFGPPGDLRASAKLSPYVPLRYELGESGSPTVVLPEAGWVHRTKTVHQLPDGVIMAQLMRFGPGGEGRDGSPTELRLLRLSDGAQLSLPDTLPSIATIREGMAWGWRNLPFPQVIQWPMEITLR